MKAKVNVSGALFPAYTKSARHLLFTILISVPTIFSLLILLNACSNNNRYVTLSQEATVLAFGDSLTQGVGSSRSESYPAFLQGLLDLKVINAGISGETSAEGLQRLEPLLKKHRPALVILCYGGNDMLQKLSIKTLEHNLEKMIAMIRAYGAEVLLVGVPKPSILLEPLPLYEALAEKHQLANDLEILSDLLSRREMKSDPIHLNKMGYEAFAHALSTRIVLN